MGDLSAGTTPDVAQLWEEVMIKVRVREQSTKQLNTELRLTESVETKEHPKGRYAQVYNGTLTIYDRVPDGALPAAEAAIAGYEPHGWLSWEKE